ncbi:MAG: chemotaxis protein CheX [Polyangiaceae bacterium]|nr:chemotaxis protein CheX [Polyangiaceae bacterium]
MTIAEQLWIDASLGALRDSISMFEADTLDVISVTTTLPVRTRGAFISIAGKSQSVELGVVCESDVQQVLSQRFLGESTTLSEEEVADAMREFANILAGGLKGAMVQHDPTLALGLPLFVDGIHPSPATRTHSAQVMLADQELCLVVIVGSLGLAA